MRRLNVIDIIETVFVVLLLYFVIIGLLWVSFGK